MKLKSGINKMENRKTMIENGRNENSAEVSKENWESRLLRHLVYMVSL